MKTVTALFGLLLSTASYAVASPLKSDAILYSQASENLEGWKTGHEGGSLIDRLRSEKMFSRFVEVIEKERGLRDDLENRDRQTTVFAPTNEAFERLEKEMGAAGKGDNQRMGEMLRYHICPDMELRMDDMVSGTLLSTGLKLRDLDDRHQRIRVFRFHGDVWLNMRARVHKKGMEAENGRIFAIDRVLMMPHHAREMLYMVPTETSTFLAGAERTGVSHLMREERGLTIFAPSNEAWNRLGFENLRYLFSCVGQKHEGERRGVRHGRGEDHEMKCQGMHDLRKILMYHMGRDVAWSTDMMEKHNMRIRTMHGNNEISIEAKQRRGRDRLECKDHNRVCDPRMFNFIINDGEARIAFTDVLARNGDIHMIDDVLIPRDVNLPYDRLN
ncbi:hypothetical protein HDU85_002394 [Gaertneriomyces sp. JEL0708]|nr:hypothetical protein HDU85_002394 [Gaertneriomyces sp. JEL0708]